MSVTPGPDAPATPASPARSGGVRRVRAPSARAVFVGATALLLVVVADLARDALGPFVVGLLLAYLLAPAVDRLSAEPLGLPRWAAILLIYLAVALALIVAASVVLRPMVGQLQEFIAELPSLLADLGAWYAALELPDWARAFIDRVVAGAQEAGGDGGFDASGLLPVASTLAGTAAAAFGYLIVPIWVFYLVKDLHRLTAGLHRAIPPAWRTDIVAVLGIVDHTFGRWVRAQLLLGLVVGVATFLGLVVLGQLVDPVFLSFSILLAVVAGILELVPVIGPILSMVPTLLLAVTTDDPVAAAFAVVLLYLVVQQVENTVLVPRIQGGAVELHPTMVLVALFVGGALFGFLGAVLAVPVTAAARDIFRYLFRRLSEDDPEVAHPDAPDLARKTGRAPVAARDAGPTTSPDLGVPVDGPFGSGPDRNPPA